MPLGCPHGRASSDKYAGIPERGFTNILWADCPSWNGCNLPLLDLPLCTKNFWGNRRLHTWTDVLQQHGTPCEDGANDYQVTVGVE